MKICEQRESHIHGKGIFALCDIEKGSTLFETHIKNNFGCWMNLDPNYKYNHSVSNTNCISSTKGQTKFLVAKKNIKIGEELLVDYTKDGDLEQPQKGWIE